MGQGLIGRKVLRKEDLRLVTGQGCYADDLHAPGVVYAAFVRSPHAHARILSIRTSEAERLPGVLAILTGADAAAEGLRPIPHATGSSKAGSDMPLANRDGSERLVTAHMPLPVDTVRFVGEPTVMVVAESLTQAKDAAEAVVVEWEALPAVCRAIEAVREDAPLLWENVPANLALDAELGCAEATAQAFDRAARRVALTTWIQRVTGVHMEPRAFMAEWDPAAGRYTIHASHGIGAVHMRAEVAKALAVEESRVRIVAPPDVGGNFGTRNATYPDSILIAWAARKLNRPVKYTAERQDAMVSDFQGRDLHVEAELALDAEGRFLALRSVNTSNVGAYTTSFVPLNKGAQLMTSLYKIPSAHVQARAVVTNTQATIPYRSAGRPEAIYTIERLIDLAAQRYGFDRIELRRRNMIPPAEQPYRNPFGVVYDNGDYTRVMDHALELADWTGFPARRAAARARGQCGGIAVANYIETAGGFPRERADIEVRSDGYVDVVVGTQSTGQGHETSFAQITAEWLGVPLERVKIRAGDTDFVKAGGGSHSGRSMRFASLVIREATVAIIEKGRALAAALFEADPADVAFDEGSFAVRGTDRVLTLFEVAAKAATALEIPEALRGPLAAASDKVTPGHAFPYGAAVCEVEVDPETGATKIVRYTSVDDVGRAVNPMILDGQTHGGIVQGVGQALLERVFYEPGSGQNLSASFMDYTMPRASDFPSFTTALSEVPAASHPLGFRPGGEGGTTPALATTINAIVDALSEFGVTHVEMPATPLQVWRAIEDAKKHRRSPAGAGAWAITATSCEGRKP